MRCLNKNKQKLYYALFDHSEPEYELDDEGNRVEDDDGNYIETGANLLLYDVAVEFMGNIALSGSDVTRQEFGVSEDRYEAVLVTNKGQLPITETSLLWYQTEPTTKVIEGETYADETTADYRILKVVPSLNNDRYILAKVVK